MSKTSKSKKIKMPSMVDIMAQVKADQLKKADKVKYHSNLLFDTLAKTKVSSIEVTFDGCGDSGQVESVDYTDANGKSLDVSKKIVKGSLTTAYMQYSEKTKQLEQGQSKEGTVREIIEEICYDKLGASHGGWELNEGSYGTFFFDVAARKVRLEYNERIEEVRTSEESF
jgi:uncharacterized protein YyaL (SSP411 family)